MYGLRAVSLSPDKRETNLTRAPRDSRLTQVKNFSTATAFYSYHFQRDFLGGPVVKNLTANAGGNKGSIPGPGRSLGTTKPMHPNY